VSVPLDPALFADGPARDSRFTMCDVWAEMTNLPENDGQMTPEFLHRQMNEEMNGLEIAARNLVDFPEADWDLRMAIARQAWDEARHVVAFRRCYEHRGGRVGQFPVLNFQYRIATRIDNLAGRLAVQNRSFEAAGIDAIQDGIEASRRNGQADLVELLDTQLADEVQHVRYANTWIPRLIEKQGPRATFEVVRAVAQANAALKVVAGEALTVYPVSDDLRREAGFSQAEIDTVKAGTANVTATPGR
jgi:uncharacterized ferritin-like protein (DUF455 family)